MQESRQAKVYKASAGSGKTFRLAIEYLKIVLNRPDAFQNILAVTFTNKATKEMKERIVGVLEELAHAKDEENGYMKVLLGELKKEAKGVEWCREEISKRATQALAQILHGYSNFRIQTIDSFFQSIFRGMLKELAIGSAPSLELDNSQTIEQAIENLYQRLGEDKVLMDWTSRYVAEKIEDGKSWRIDEELKDLGGEITKETFKGGESLEETKGVLGTERLMTIRNEMGNVKKLMTEVLRDYARQFFDYCNRNGIVQDDLRGKSRSAVWSYFNKCLNKQGDYGKDDFLSETMQKTMRGEGAVASKDARTAVNAQWIVDLMNEAESQRDAYKYNTANLILKNMKLIGMASEMQEQMRRVNDEEGRFALSDTNMLLRKIIDKDTAPFIYERIGTLVDHIMIDEFQDTSRMQWENFHSLLEETQARGGLNLIVGDPKQAIYRWRNGDWRIIEGLGKDETLRVSEENMEDNYRSSWRVINFNNAVFRASLHFLPEKPADLCDCINAIYGGAMQNCKKGERGGYVEVKFFESEKKGKKENKGEEDEAKEEEKETIKEKIMRRMGDTMLRLNSENGIAYEKMAVITRTNRQIEEIAQFFAKNEEYKDLNIVSDEAFKLGTSDIVCAMIDALKYILEYINERNQTTEEEGEEKDDGKKKRHKESATVAALAVDYQRIRNDREAKDVVSDVRFANDAELQELLGELRKLVGMPLYEMVEEVHYLLTQREDMKAKECDPFVQSFMDAVQSFISSRGTDLSLFLKHWDEKLSGKAVSMGDEGVEGIRALTIHKSKGLEFDTLFVPFADWKSVDYSKSTNIWCRYDEEWLPIRFSEEMKNSRFSEEYNEELAQIWVDNVNVLYVALTRAQNNLFVYSVLKEQDAKRDKCICSMANILYDAIIAVDCEEEEGDPETVKAQKKELRMLRGEMVSVAGEERETGWFPNKNELRIGQLPKKEDSNEAGDAKKKQKNVYRLNAEAVAITVEARGHRLKAKFRQSNRSRTFVRDPEEYVMNEEKAGGISEYISRGKMLHSVFSRVKTKESVERAVREAYYEGVIESEEKASEVQKYVLEKMESAPEWFAEGVVLMNEREITVRENGVLVRKRPDRVIIDGKRATVVDFKFGKEAVAYREQVAEYMRLIKDMGYEEVKGYLWYVDKGKKEEVL